LQMRIVGHDGAHRTRPVLDVAFYDDARTVVTVRDRTLG
jgi:hypothetical protein